MDSLLTFSKIAPGINTLGIAGLFIMGLIVIVLASVKVYPNVREIALRQRESSEARMQRRIDRLERRLDLANAHHDGEVGILRHALGNRTQCLESLFRLLKFNPDRVSDVLTEIEADHARNLENERLEAARVRGEMIKAVAQLDAEEREDRESE